MRLAFVDKDNCIFHLCEESKSLQENFDMFVQKIHKHGIFGSPSVGEIHLVQMESIVPETGLLHLNTERESGWDVKPIPGLVWPGEQHGGSDGPGKTTTVRPPVPAG